MGQLQAHAHTKMPAMVVLLIATSAWVCAPIWLMGLGFRRVAARWLAVASMKCVASAEGCCRTVVLTAPCSYECRALSPYTVLLVVTAAQVWQQLGAALVAAVNRNRLSLAVNRKRLHARQRMTLCVIRSALVIQTAVLSARLHAW